MKKKLLIIFVSIMVLVVICIVTFVAKNNSNSFYYVGVLDETSADVYKVHSEYYFNKTEELLFIWSDARKINIKTDGNKIVISESKRGNSFLHVIKINRKKDIYINDLKIN